MPLQQIAKHIVILADRRASTPVLITPPYLSFRASFYIELTRELSTHTNRSIRIDWYKGMPTPTTLLSHQVAAWQVRSINRALLRQTSGTRHRRTQMTRGIENSSSQNFQQGDQAPPALQPREHAPIASVQIAATIARPGGQNRDLVIGLADARLQLPLWTTAIWLGSSPAEIQRLKSA